MQDRSGEFERHRPRLFGIAYRMLGSRTDAEDVLQDARAEGDSEQRLYTLSAWRETPFFDERERAALEWTEAVTLVAETHVPDEVYERVKQHFTEQEVMELTLAIAQINLWNRLNVAFRTVPGSYRAGMYKEWMAAAGGARG